MKKTKEPSKEEMCDVGMDYLRTEVKKIVKEEISKVTALLVDNTLMDILNHAVFALKNDLQQEDIDKARACPHYQAGMRTLIDRVLKDNLMTEEEMRALIAKNDGGKSKKKVETFKIAGYHLFKNDSEA